MQAESLQKTTSVHRDLEKPNTVIVDVPIKDENTQSILQSEGVAYGPESIPKAT